jgi:hypothetical protein
MWSLRGDSFYTSFSNRSRPRNRLSRRQSAAYAASRNFPRTAVTLAYRYYGQRRMRMGRRLSGVIARAAYGENTNSDAPLACPQLSRPPVLPVLRLQRSTCPCSVLWDNCFASVFHASLVPRHIQVNRDVKLDDPARIAVPPAPRAAEGSDRGGINGAAQCRRHTGLPSRRLVELGRSVEPEGSHANRQSNRGGLRLEHDGTH